jgi:hypothetical protein
MVEIALTLCYISKNLMDVYQSIRNISRGSELLGTPSWLACMESSQISREEKERHGLSIGDRASVPPLSASRGNIYLK